MYQMHILMGTVESLPHKRGAAVTLEVKTWRDDGKGSSRPTIHKVEVFRPYDSFALSLKIGDVVHVEGMVERSTYRDRNNNMKEWVSTKTTRIFRMQNDFRSMHRGGRDAGPPRHNGTMSAPTSAPIPEEETSRISRPVRRRPRKVQVTDAQPESFENFGTSNMWDQ